MKEEFLISCGEWKDKVVVDRGIFNNYKDACFEAATKSFEKYFKTKSIKERSLTTCVVRPSKTPNNKNDYLIFPPKLYENIGFHVVNEYFKKINHG